MNAAELIRRLYREKKDWESYGNGPEVSWTRQGIEKALLIAHNLAREEKKQAALKRPRLSRWIAGELYNAIRVASDNLKRGDRARAIEILDRARASADQIRRAP